MHHHGPFYGTHGSFIARDASQRAQRAASDAKRTRSELQFLRSRVEGLALMCESLWLLLKARAGYTDEELERIARDLDLSDGRLDGKVRRTAVTCLGCGRTIGKRHARCLYCGAESERAPFSGA